MGEQDGGDDKDDGAAVSSKRLSTAVDLCSSAIERAEAVLGAYATYVESHLHCALVLPRSFSNLTHVAEQIEQKRRKKADDEAAGVVQAASRGRLSARAV